ncbi:MAG: alpha/beta hydrolase [Moorea sp. SIO2B7]|nr:alpha/beta hydrolase [Moorena sp. SIO2B7]
MTTITFNPDLNNSRTHNPFSFRRWLHTLALGFLSIVLSHIPVDATERVYFNYDALGFSLSVDSLETFAVEGKINKELSFYIPVVSKEDQALFRKALLKKEDINHIQLYRFFHTPMGEDIIDRFGDLNQI